MLDNRRISRELRYIGQLLFYGLLPLGIAVLALHIKEIPVFYLIFLFLLLDTLIHGLETVTLRIISTIAALTVYLAYRQMSGLLTTTDLIHMVVVFLGTVGLMVIVDRKRRDLEEARRGLTETRREMGQYRALSEFGVEMSSGIERQEVCRMVVERLNEVLEAEMAQMYLFDEEESEAELWVTDGQKTRVFLTQSNNFRGINDWAEAFLPVAGADPQRSSFTTLSLPLVAHGQVIGKLAVAKGRTASFLPGDSDLLHRFAETIVVEVENSKLYARIREMIERETKHLLTEEIHRNLAQDLSALGIKLQTAQLRARRGLFPKVEEDLVDLNGVVDRLHREVRELTHFRLPDRDDFGFLDTLKRFAGTLAQEKGINVELVMPSREDWDAEAVSDTSSIGRVREIVQSVLDLPLARPIQVLLEVRKGGFSVTVESGEAEMEPGGLESLGERLRSLGNRAEILVGPGYGPKIHIQVPFDQRED